MEVSAPCELLPWDSEFFGRRIARATIHRLSAESVEAIVEWCGANAIECLYFLADSDHAETVRLAEDHGFRLVDIRVTLQSKSASFKAAPNRVSSSPLHVRPARPSDTLALEQIARASYGYSRFCYDPCFPQERCDALYQTWIRRSCEGYADLVLVAEMNGMPVGYVSCHLASPAPRGQIGLVGVGAQARGGGVGQILIDQALIWFAEHGAEVVSVVTQGRNIGAQRLYQRCGFMTQSVQLWYHKWMSHCIPQQDR